jgi:26S proteasome regulatory subunit N12
MARDVYESAALLSIHQEDTVGFERHVSQAKTYYFDYAGVLEPSGNQNLILALNLMRLLAQNRIAEFHTELELLPSAARLDPAVSYVLSLEQYLMEGSYAKITASGDAMPNRAFEFFLSILAVTVRDEIAACSERSYKQLTVPFTMKLLSFSSEDDVRAFAAAREWAVVGDVIHFVDTAEHAPSMEMVPSAELIKRTLFYAGRLEQIV